jgi:hypothetical protein
MAVGNYDLVFDGENDYIEIADSADFSAAATGQLSVSAWIRPDVAAADWHPRSRELLSWSHPRSEILEPRFDGDGGQRALWRQISECGARARRLHGAIQVRGYHRQPPHTGQNPIPL